MNLGQLVQEVVEHCQKNNLNKVYICGNGGSGKTTLSKKICDVASEYGAVNRISTDDFMVDFNLREKAVDKWSENGIDYEGRYTSSNIETYFWKNIYEIIYNIDHGVDCYYFPRRYKEKNNIRQLKSDYFLTVIEGIGTAFLERDCEKSLSIFLKCNKKIEIARREKRNEILKWSASDLYDEKRSSQYRVNVLSRENEFDWILVNDDNFNYEYESI